MSNAQPDTSVLPIVQVAVDALLPGFPVRLSGPSEENIESLCAAGSALPPILVHRPTNRVVDGMHRVLAARRCGRAKIAARYVDGDEAAAFVLAVSANVAHGLPLPLRDRKVAAARILGTHSDWSNRRIAQVAGLTDKTVGVIRARIEVSGEADAVSRRVGRDGRVRPVDFRARRDEIRRLIEQDPDSSLRLIAGRAGVSPETVRSVKAGLATTGGAPGASASGRGPAASGGTPQDPRRWLQFLVVDPALRSTDTGRLLLRLLSGYPVLEQEAEQLVNAAPEHALVNLQRLAAAHAEAWHDLAARATARMGRGGGRGRSAEPTGYSSAA